MNTRDAERLVRRIRFELYRLRNKLWRPRVKPQLRRWSEFEDEEVETFLRSPLDGVENPSRAKIRDIVDGLGYKPLLVEVGCGTGVEYEGFKKYGCSVKYVGIDVTSKMLQAAKRFNPEIEVVRGDTFHLPLRNRSVDILLCRAVLEHLADYKQAVSEFFRVTRHLIIFVFFIPLSDRNQDEIVMYRGFYNNIYSRRNFLSFVAQCGGTVREFHSLPGYWALGFTQQVYVVERNKVEQSC